MVNSGVRFVRALEILAERQRNLHFQRVLQSVVYDMVHNGASFSQAMAKYPRIFAPEEVKMVLSGEMTGRLEETLESIADQIQKNIQLSLRIRSALMYPITVIIAIVLAAFVIMILVVPKFMILFSEFPNAELPIATRILIGTSSFLREAWWFLLTLGIASVFVFRNWKQSERGRKKWDGFLLKMPLFRGIVRNIQTVRISSNFSTLIQSGIPITKALQLLSEIIPNSVIGRAILNVKEKIIHGKKIHAAFSEEPAFDPILGEIIEIGEKSGRLSEILEKTASQYQNEVDAQLKNLTTLIEPLVIVLVGGAIVFMALAIMTPIFRLQELFMNT
ncbi:type II secretion system F family protein [Candidatus Gracilibacteria bacterium]|nr:type II secretion system F family protein [Candidatus Gracilibacteria bacterium]MCF7819213.1 type II secretion system F family protein [Candidatus Gracilibacteria bacterium]